MIVDDEVWSGYCNGDIVVWDRKNGTMLLELLGHGSEVLSLLHFRGTIWSGSNDWEVKVRNRDGGALLRILPDGHRDWVRTLLEVDGKVWSVTDDKIQIWNGEYGEKLGSIEVKAKIQGVCMVGNTAWVGCQDGTIRIFPQQWRCSRKFQAHRSAVTCLLCVGSHVWTGSVDKTVKIWDRSSYKLIDVMNFNNPVSALALAGSQVWIGGRGVVGVRQATGITDWILQWVDTLTYRVDNFLEDQEGINLRLQEKEYQENIENEDKPDWVCFLSFPEQAYDKLVDESNAKLREFQEMSSKNEGATSTKLTEMIEILDKKSKEFRERVSHADTEKRGLSDKIKELEDEITALKRQLADALGEINYLVQKEEQNMEEIKSQQDKLQQLRDTIQQHRDKMQQVQDTLQQDRDKMQQQWNKIHQLQDEVQQQRGTIQQQQGKLEQQEHKLQQQNLLIVEKGNVIFELQSQLERSVNISTQNSQQSSDGEVAVYKNRLDEMTKKTEEDAKVKLDLEKKLGVMEDEMTKKTKEDTKLKLELEKKLDEMAKKTKEDAKLKLELEKKLKLMGDEMTRMKRVKDAVKDAATITDLTPQRDSPQKSTTALQLEPQTVAALKNENNNNGSDSSISNSSNSEQELLTSQNRELNEKLRILEKRAREIIGTEEMWQSRAREYMEVLANAKRVVGNIHTNTSLLSTKLHNHSPFGLVCVLFLCIVVFLLLGFIFALEPRHHLHKKFPN